MTLTKNQLKRMEYLIGKKRANGYLDITEENELRSLISKENPNAQNANIDDLVALGLIIVGAYLLYKIFEK
ncbi:hypothetical protein [Methanolacinia paynteri]|uniref:hypothetical protein n=1 Tax=Methanolacinia paynteri TaxID=230356 RepID=UPI00064E3D01|nr:hypothetical protein [Methanolacinia paynteri]